MGDSEENGKEEGRDGAKAASAPEKSKMKLIVLAVIALVVVGGAVAAGVYLGRGMGGEKTASTDPVDPTAEELAADAEHGAPDEDHGAEEEEAGGHGAAADSGGHGGGHGGGEEEADAAPDENQKMLMIGVMTNPADPNTRRRVEGQIWIEAKDVETAEVLRKNQHRITDEVIMIVGSKPESVLNSTEGKELMKGEIRTAVDRMFGGGVVEAVGYTFIQTTY